jgi:hypothetical protein
MLVWGFEVEGLVGAVVVVAVEPGAQFEPGVFNGCEAVAPAELFLEGLDDALAESVLLRGKK